MRSLRLCLPPWKGKERHTNLSHKPVFTFSWEKGILENDEVVSLFLLQIAYVVDY
jgi:hypothetical protein